MPSAVLNTLVLTITFEIVFLYPSLIAGELKTERNHTRYQTNNLLLIFNNNTTSSPDLGDIVYHWGLQSDVAHGEAPRSPFLQDAFQLNIGMHTC